MVQKTDVFERALDVVWLCIWYTSKMLKLPDTFILFDSEYTAWEGSKDRNWTGEGEHREIVQMGAIIVENSSLRETNYFLRLVKPKINPELSAYFTTLTNITQSDVDAQGVSLEQALQEFKAWCGDYPLYSYGKDGEIVIENCALLQIPCPFSEAQFHDIREFFKTHGVPTQQYMSSTVVRAFGGKPARTGHDALNDARLVLDALILLQKRTEALSQGKSV